jgi:hypothetical protein
VSWRTTIEGTSPPLTIYERADRDGKLYLKWSEGDSHRRPSLKPPEGEEPIGSVRNEQGEIDPDLVGKVRKQALSQYRKARAGDPTATPSKKDSGPLTLRAGRDEVLRIPGGKYPTKTQDYGDMRRALDRVCEILGDDFLWRDLRPKHYTHIWRTFARRKQEDEDALGWRMAELTCGKLQTASRWLHEQELIDRAATTPSRWHEQLKSEWQEILDLRKEPEPERPRHTEDEVRRLHGHLDEADPRLRLGFGLGAEYRMGQAVRSNRSDLDLSEEAGSGHGTFRIHGSKRKEGELVFLTPGQRAIVDEVLGPDGHLSEFEAAYQSGELDDYPLFPGGKLRQGKSVPREPQKRMRIETLRGYFRDLEDAAGVEHVDQRAFYGVRRGSTDAVSAHTVDEEVRDRSGGWAGAEGGRGERSRGKGTRRTVYRHSEDPRPRAEAAEVRRRVRGEVDADGPDGGVDDPSSGTDAGATREERLKNSLRDVGLDVPEEKLTAVLSLLES